MNGYRRRGQGSASASGCGQVMPENANASERSGRSLNDCRSQSPRCGSENGSESVADHGYDHGRGYDRAHDYGHE